MSTLDRKLTEATLQYIKTFGNKDHFKVWVEKVDSEEKYVVHCSYHDTWLGKSTTFEYSKTIKED